MSDTVATILAAYQRHVPSEDVGRLAGHFTMSLHRNTAVSVRTGRPTKILLIGNSGAGKSFLGNVLLEQDMLVTLAQRVRVTAVSQTAPMGSSPALVHTSAAATTVGDAPGLLEGGETNLEANAAEIVKALAAKAMCSLST